jgi:hypothetical protein
MRWIALLLALTFAAGCYAPPRKAKACSTCSGARPASRATHIK